MGPDHGDSARCLYIIRFRRGTHRVEPATDVHLGVAFSAEVACFSRTGSLSVPSKNRELRISALNHKPVNGIAGHRPADLTSEFLQRCHKFLTVDQRAARHSDSSSSTLSKGENHCNPRIPVPRLNVGAIRRQQSSNQRDTSAQRPSKTPVGNFEWSLDLTEC